MDRAYVINLDQYKSIEDHWITLYANGDNVRYFDSLGVKYIHRQKKYQKKYLQNASK